MANVICPHCNHSLAYVPTLAGQQVRCSACGNQFVMSSPDEPPAPPPVTAAPDPSRFAEQPVTLPRRSLAERGGFEPARSILDVFDFRFERYVTPIILRFTWILALLLAALWLI